MNNYRDLLDDLLRAAGEIYFRRVSAELDKFADALHVWLYDLFALPRIDWREDLDRLLAQQRAEGRIITPESRQGVVAYLEWWAKTVDWQKASGVTFVPKAEAPARPVPWNWPALTTAEKEAAQRSTGLPWWYPIQPRNWTDSDWQEHFVLLGKTSRERLLEFYHAVAALGRAARDIKDPEQFDIDSLAPHHLAIQQRYDEYLKSKVEIYREWNQYLAEQWFVGPEVVSVFRKIDNALPDGIEGFESPHRNELKAVRRAGYEAIARKRQNTDTAATALEWTDKVITAIEIITLVGSAKAVFKQAAIKMIRKGLCKSAAKKVALAYVAAHLGVAAASAVVVAGVVPPVLAAAGLDEAEVSAGLVLFRTAFTLVGLRAMSKGRPGRDTGKSEATGSRNGKGESGSISATKTDGAGRGWLQRWEGRGIGNSRGHVIAEHVGKSDSYLLARVGGNKISSASTFTDQITAEAVIGRAIQLNRIQLNAWLRTARQGDRLRLSYTGVGVIGRGIKKGESLVGDRVNARIVLQAMGNRRYHILTAFPE